MKKKQFSAEYVSFLCSEIHLILKAGIPLGEAFSIMADEEKDKDTAEVLATIGERINLGDSLSDVFEESGKFPRHMTDMIAMGYQTGYLEDVFSELSDYYDRENRLSASVRSAVTYPAVLLFMMLCVILILLVKVLPIFKSVYDQIGGSMSGTATVLLNIGVFLGAHLGIVIVTVLVLLALLAAIVINSRKQGKITVFMSKRLQKMAGAARFTSAISMAVSSGLSVDEAFEMTEKMDFDKETTEGIKAARAAMEEGKNFAEAMHETGLFSSIHDRMIALGYKSGDIDTVLREVSTQTHRMVSEELDSLIGKIEPTLVIVLSVITGLILLSVMLPLMDVMSVIG